MTHVLEDHLTAIEHKPIGISADKCAANLIKFFAFDHVGDLTYFRQKEFMEWCSREKGHSIGYIGFMLGIVSAAVHRAHEKGELLYCPKIYSGLQRIADALDEPVPEAAEYARPIEEIAALLDAIKYDHVFRFVMLGLNTLARPAAIMDLTRFQVNRRDGLVNLNPAGRKQTKKYRPTIPISKTLDGWLEIWDGDHLIQHGKRRVYNCRGGLRRASDNAGIQRVNQYTFRHTMAKVGRQKGVPIDQIAMMLGHKRPGYGMTERYTKYDPTYLRDMVRAIDSYFEELQDLTARRVLPPKIALQVRAVPANDWR